MTFVGDVEAEFARAAGRGAGPARHDPAFDAVWSDPGAHLAACQPDHPVYYFADPILRATARRFRAGFPGEVTYAVKANPDPSILRSLAAMGIGAFDVASSWEIDTVARVVPGARLHFNNPVRSEAEIAHAVRAGVRSFAVDSHSELQKLVRIVPSGAELSVRYKLPVPGAAYDFGSKFGLTPGDAATLLRGAERAGFVASLTCHPGTQCVDPGAWVAYIEAAGRIAAGAEVAPARLNLGGGFPSHRGGDAPRLGAIFEAIADTVPRVFGARQPALLCEPGRAMVAEAVTLATRVRAIRDGGDVFLNDGIYGGLGEAPLLGALGRVEVRRSDGVVRTGRGVPRTVFGPTCDSVDRLPGEVMLPTGIAEGDYVLFHGAGAYGTATATRFNGFGAYETVSVAAHAALERCA